MTNSSSELAKDDDRAEHHRREHPGSEAWRCRVGADDDGEHDDRDGDERADHQLQSAIRYLPPGRER